MGGLVNEASHEVVATHASTSTDMDFADRFGSSIILRTAGRVFSANAALSVDVICISMGVVG